MSVSHAFTTASLLLGSRFQWWLPLHYFIGIRSIGGLDINDQCMYNAVLILLFHLAKLSAPLLHCSQECRGLSLLHWYQEYIHSMHV